MKASKKLLSLLLAAVMIMSLCVSAFAATVENVKQYKRYLCLGDSISAGCGVPFADVDLSQYDASLKYYYQMYHGYNYEIVPNAYHSLVAEAVGAELIQGGISGNRSVEMRYMLDGNYNDCDDTGAWGYVFFGSDGTLADTCAKLDACDALLKDKFGVGYKEAVKTSDLITINLGSNDVLSYSAMFAMAALGQEYKSDSMITKLLEKLANTGDVFGVFSQFLEYANTIGMLNEVLSTLSKCLVSSSTTFKTNIKCIVKDIYEINPDTTVVGVGIYNPFNQFVLSDDINVKVGALMEPIVADLNLFLKSLELSYKGYKYANCSNTEIYTFGLDNVSTGDYATKVHPTLEGHKYMTRQILSVLPTKDSSEPASSALPFKDVPKSYWAYNEISYVYKNGIMIGTTADRFSPDRLMTRAQFVTVLYRMARGSSEGLSENFKDVNKGYWAYDAIVWACNKGIIKGFGDNTFRPEANISRAQLVTMLYRYAGSPAVKGDLKQFSDAGSIAAPYVDAVIWATENGIIKGYADGSFRPNNSATRAHVAVMIARYCAE